MKFQARDWEAVGVPARTRWQARCLRYELRKYMVSCREGHKRSAV